MKHAPKQAPNLHQCLWEQARAVIPGGVDSPVRSFSQTGVRPVFAQRARGKYLFAADGRRFVDFCLSWGAIILGHNAPPIRRRARKALAGGTSFGLATAQETELARLVSQVFPSIEKIRFVSSGTEAVMSAVRLARGYTGRTSIIKFDGCYHGHSDGLLVKAGSGVTAMPASSSAGIPPGIARDTMSLPFNDIETFRRTIEAKAAETAAVIIEPVPGNMGVIPPRKGFLNSIREITRRHGIVLIFDEVITGFRVCLGGVQHLESITPDLTVLGKILGGGMPIGGFGGRAEIMDRLAPEGDVYQAGTLSGNPLSIGAGIAAVTTLMQRPVIYDRMRTMVDELEEAARAIPEITLNRYSTMFSIFFRNGPVDSFESARVQDFTRYRAWYARLIECGLLFPPSPFETAFLSGKHSRRDILRLLRTLQCEKKGGNARSQAECNQGNGC